MKTKFKYKEKVLAILPDKRYCIGVVDGYELFTHKYMIFCGDQIGTEYFTTKELLKLDNEEMKDE